MKLFSPEPTGPFFSYQALPCPLPIQAQQELRHLSAIASDARKDQNFKALTAAHKAIDEFTESARKVIGVEVLRRWHEPTGVSFA